MQEGKKAFIKKGGEMLIAIVLDKPLAEAQALVQVPQCIHASHHKHSHPVIAQMLNPDVKDDLPPSECATGLQKARAAVQERRATPNIFFCSNASIAFARSLYECLLAVLIHAREAERRATPNSHRPNKYSPTANAAFPPAGGCPYCLRP